MSVIISVVIPTYNRRESLQRTLESLAIQTYPTDCFEAIVVDDGSTDDTKEVANMSFPFCLRYVYQTNQGDALARNHGAQLSESDLLIFVDDDIIVTPKFIANIVAEQAKVEKCLVLGTLLPMPEKAQTPYQEYISAVWDKNNQQSGVVPFTKCLSGFMAVKADEYRALGMLQPVAQTGSSVWCDVEFAYRAHLQGFVLRRSAEAIGYHDDYALRDLETYRKRMYRAGRFAVLLLQKHPELEQIVPLFRDRSFVVWDKDSPAIIVRKLWRSMMGWLLTMASMKRIIQFLEKRQLAPIVLKRLCIWYISSAITLGIRQGIREFGTW